MTCPIVNSVLNLHFAKFKLPKLAEVSSTKRSKERKILAINFYFICKQQTKSFVLISWISIEIFTLLNPKGINKKITTTNLNRQTSKGINLH